MRFIHKHKENITGPTRNGKEGCGHWRLIWGCWKL